MGGISLVELFKDMDSRFRFHTTASVAYLHDHGMICRFQTDTNGTTVRSEFHSIGDQIVPHKTQQFRVGFDANIILYIRFDFQILSFPGIFKLQKALAKLLSQIKFLGLGKYLLIFQLVQLQNVGDQLGQLSCRFRNSFGIFVFFFFCDSGLLEHSSVIAHHRQRGFQFMGHIGDKVRAQCLRSGKFFRHFIDCFPDLIETVGTCAVDGRYADGKIPLHNLFSSFRDLLNRAIYRDFSANIIHRTENKCDQQNITKGLLCRRAYIICC